MGPSLKRWRWAVLLLAALAGGLLFAFWPQPLPVDAAPVIRGPMLVGITDDGITRVRRLHIVSAPITGYLEPIMLESGDTVARGRASHIVNRAAADRERLIDEGKARQRGPKLPPGISMGPGAASPSEFEQFPSVTAAGIDTGSHGRLPLLRVALGRCSVLVLA